MRRALRYSVATALAVCLGALAAASPSMPALTVGPSGHKALLARSARTLRTLVDRDIQDATQPPSPGSSLAIPELHAESRLTCAHAQLPLTGASAPQSGRAPPSLSRTNI